MKFRIYLLLLLGCIQIGKAQSFDLIPIGIYGGGEESNLSAYLISEKDKNEFLCLDAGTLRSGIDKAIEKGNFKGENIEVIRNYIKGYFISHGHLDHLSGLIINSPDDSKKNIYGIPETIDVLKNRYFTNDAWINFANEGDQPQLGKYTYKRINNTDTFPIDRTNLRGQVFKLSHVFPQKSSAIMVSNNQGEAVLYLGDTGADRIEKSDLLHQLWQGVAPDLKNNKLKAILIETSFDNQRDEKLLFGHLTPKLLTEELQNLAKISKMKDLKGLKIIITHLKPGGNQIEKIKSELKTFNPLQVEYIFPVQGEKISL